MYICSVTPTLGARISKPEGKSLGRQWLCKDFDQSRDRNNGCTRNNRGIVGSGVFDLAFKDIKIRRSKCNFVLDGNVWAALFLVKINSGTWSSMLRKSPILERKIRS
jgi:hypothetical protein